MRSIEFALPHRPSKTHHGKPTMMFRVPRSATAPFVAAIALMLAAPAAAQSAASPWSRSAHSSIRLLDGGPARDGERIAGIEITLAPEFKTYWRDPGDSGLPPVFDWSASTNVRDVVVFWPAPHRFDDSAGSSIGYSEDLILPLAVTPQNPSQPMTLRLKADYAVCSTICIPGRGETALSIQPAARQDFGIVQRIAAFRRRVPARAEIGDPTMPGVLRVAPAQKAVEIEGRVPASARIADVFVEAPEGWLFGAAVPSVVLAEGPDTRRIVWRVPAVDRPDGGTIEGLPITVTVVADDEGVEYRLKLDAAAPAR